MVGGEHVAIAQEYKHRARALYLLSSRAARIPASTVRWNGQALGLVVVDDDDAERGPLTKTARTQGCGKEAGDP